MVCNQKGYTNIQNNQKNNKKERVIRECIDPFLLNLGNFSREAYSVRGAP
jgi:hypothetical protein